MKVDTKEFIRRAKKVHGNKYDYSHVELVGPLRSRIKGRTIIHVKIKCRKHGFFDQIPRYHLGGSGCKLRSFENSTKTKKQFIIDARQVHGKKYGYDKVDYKNSQTKIKIECKTHGFFSLRPDHHLTGSGCRKCVTEAQKRKFTKSRDQFITEAKKVWGNKFDYSHVNYINNKTHVKIKCKIHGFFHQFPMHHLRDHRSIGGRQGCSDCIDRLSSKGVQAVDLFLKQTKVDYERERRFPDLKSKRRLPVDFWLPKLKTIIEFDGEHHSKISLYADTEDKLLTIQKHDRIKDKWAKKHGYKMIRISYTQIKNINEILTIELRVSNVIRGITNWR
jgi:very-short-patch-repair endonuclease